MNFYQSVFIEKKLCGKYSKKKAGLGVITLQYLPFRAFKTRPHLKVFKCMCTVFSVLKLVL